MSCLCRVEALSGGPEKDKSEVDGRERARQGSDVKQSATWMANSEKELLGRVSRGVGAGC